MYLRIALFILLETSYICNGHNENFCNVLPKDPYVEKGSDIDVVCLRTCVKGKINWEMNSRPLNKTLSKTNASHSVLTLKTFTDRTAVISCNSEDKQQLLGGTIVRTYTKPSKPLCILHYKEGLDYGVPDRFTCSWEHQPQPQVETKYTVICESCNPPEEMCSSRGTTCTMENAHISGKILFGRNITVSVRATSAAWEVTSNSSDINPYHIFKLNTPKLEVQTTSSDELLVTWSQSTSMQRENYCQVKYTKFQAVDDGNQTWVINTTLSPWEKGNVTIEKLQSCSNYRFAVRCALDKAPWSDWSQEETVVTKLHKGDVQLHLWRKITEPDKSGTRNVHIMWKEIPSSCRETLTFSVEASPCEEHLSGANCSETPCGSSTCDVVVNGDAHRINLTVSSDETPFVEDSVYVPAIGESLPQATNIQTLTLDGVIRVSWDAPVQPVSGYVIDYTHNGTQYHWKESNHTNTTLTDLLDMKPYDITVTPVFGGRTGHGTRALHVCSRVGDPNDIIITNVQAYDRSAHVSWTVKSREPCSGAVVNYTVYYGIPEGPQLNVTVKSTKYNLDNLDPDTQYNVYVEATALTGTTKSSNCLFRTKRFNPKLVTALSVSGTIAIVLVLSLGLCCAVQWKKFMEKPVPNPGLSSVALWPWTSHQKGMCLFPPFTEPSESLCDRVYPEGSQTSSMSSLTRDHSVHPASDHVDEYTNADMAPASDVQKGNPVGDADTSSPGESTTLLSSENGPSSPYRSQSSGETLAPESGKQQKHVQDKQVEKAKPVAVYVTMDMFKQGQSR